MVLPGDMANQREALTIALADPGAALTSFRALAAELRPDPHPAADDRRTCRQCANLTVAGRCLAATRGELPDIASRKYSPAQDLPRRCEAFSPLPGDHDQRTAHQRWPKVCESLPVPKRMPQ